MSKHLYPRTYRAIELFEAAQRELTTAMQSELGDGQLHDKAPAVLVVVNDPARSGSLLTALGRYDRMAEALATVLEDPMHAPLKKLLIRALVFTKLSRQSN